MDHNFYDGFEKKAWGFDFKVGPNAEMSKELSELREGLKELQSSTVKGFDKVTTNTVKGFDKVTTNTVDHVFNRLEKFRDPKKMLGMGLALGGGLAAGALIGRGLTRTVGKSVPIIKNIEDFREGEPNNTISDRNFGVNG